MTPTALPLLLLLAAAPAAPAPAAATAPSPPAAAGELVDRVAATVDGEVVLLSEVEERAGADLRRALAMAAGAEREEARRAALRRGFDALVGEKLLQKQAAALQLQVTDQQVDAALEDIRNRNHFTAEELEAAVAAQGLDREAFRAQVRRELETYQVLQAKIRSKVKITDDDVRNYFNSHPQEFGGEEEVHVRHVFLPLPDGASAAEEAKVRAALERILTRLRSGEDFAQVARESSRGPSAADGGDLGWLRRGTVQKALEEAAFALQPGQLSGLVRAGGGLHVVRVEGRRRGGVRGFDDVKEEIRGRLFDEQVVATRAAVLEELRKAAVLDVKVTELQPAAAR